MASWSAPKFTPTNHPTHACPVDGCGVLVRRDRLMCFEHWQLVPIPIRNNVWREWQHGEPTAAYPPQRQAAIDAVNARLARAATS